MFPIPENIGNSATTSPNMVLNFASTTASFIDPRVTFTRTQGVSNSVSTYYNSAGVLSYAGYNLLTYSSAFDNAAWTKGNSTITTAAGVAPDGTLTAQLLVESATNSTHFIQRSANTTISNSTVYATSLYVKAAGRTRICITGDGGSGNLDGGFSIFDLSTGTFVAKYAPQQIPSIVSCGNGWYRVSLVDTSTGTTASMLIALATSTYTTTSTMQTYQGDGTSGVYIWGAQLEQSSTANTYAATTAAASGAPRFDYDPVAKTPKGLLIEETRTNLLTYSQDFTNAAWIGGQVSVTANSTTAPDGTSTASKITGSGTSSQHAIRQGVTTTAGLVTYSIYAKAGTNNYLQLLTNNDSNAFANFDLSAGVIGTVGSTVTASIVSVGSSWYRCSISGNLVSNSMWYVTLITASNATRYEINSLSTTLYLWGAQIEAGAFATSYIPTTSATVQRGADNASMTGTNFSSWWNASQGTVFVQSDTTLISGYLNPYAASISDGTVNNRIAMIFTNSIANGSAFSNSIYSGGVQQGAASKAYSPAVSALKGAMTYATNSFAITGNGLTAATSASGSVPTVNQIAIGSLINASGYMNGHVQKVSYYPSALTASQIQGLTK